MKIRKDKLLRSCANVALVVYTLGAQAQDQFDRIEVEILQTARSREELNSKLEKVAELKIKNLACEIQLNSHHFPYACYEFEILALKGRNFLQNHLPRSNSQLNQHCLSAGQLSDELQINKEKVKLLPRKCQLMAVNRVRINRYKVGKNFD